MMMKRVYSDIDDNGGVQPLFSSRMKSQNFPFGEAHKKKVYDSFLAFSALAVCCVVVKRNFMAKDDASRMGE